MPQPIFTIANYSDLPLSGSERSFKGFGTKASYEEGFFFSFVPRGLTENGYRRIEYGMLSPYNLSKYL